MFVQRVKLNYKLLWLMGIVGTNLLVGTAYLGYKIIPEKIQDKLWEQKLPINGTEAWNNTFVKQPFPSQFKVYLFDIQNAAEVFEGAKPVVREMGPYVYKLNRWKDDIIIENDQISYYEYELYEFDAQASGKFQENDEVTILNLPLLSLLYTVETSPFSSYMDTIATSLDLVFGENDNLFIKVRIQDFLFKGIKMCQEKFGSGLIRDMICKQVKEKLNVSKQMWLDEDGVRFAALRYRNNTHQSYMTVKSGENNRNESGNLVELNHQPNISVWLNLNEHQCNKIRGVTSIFPINLQKNMVFEVFSEDICRAMPLKFAKIQKINQFEAFKFTSSKDTFKYSDNQNQCYCKNETLNVDGSHGCLFDGVLDGTSCVGAPILISFPHLLYGDHRYISGVDGLHPRQSSHETLVILEKVSGIPLKLSKRVQFNMFIRNIEGVEAFENITNCLVPIFWIEEEMALPQQFLEKLSTLYKFLNIFEIVKYVLIAFSCSLIVTSVGLFIYSK